MLTFKVQKMQTAGTSKRRLQLGVGNQRNTKINKRRMTRYAIGRYQQITTVVIMNTRHTTTILLPGLFQLVLPYLSELVEKIVGPLLPLPVDYSCVGFATGGTLPHGHMVRTLCPTNRRALSGDFHFSNAGKLSLVRVRVWQIQY